jgi:hypothetical protein
MLEKQLDHLHFSLRCIQEGEEEKDAIKDALHTHIAWLRIGMDKYVSQKKKTLVFGLYVVNILGFRV